MQRENSNSNKMTVELLDQEAPQTDTNVSIAAPPPSSSSSSSSLSAEQGYEVKYPAEIRSIQAKKLFKNKVLRESPETLIADYIEKEERRIKSNLLFYTQHPTAWHTALCRSYPSIKKRGISKGRQISVMEEDSTMITVNVYNNGTIMVQGSESILDQFALGFQKLKDLAATEKQEPEPATMQNEAPPNTDPGSEATPPTPCSPASPKVYNNIKALRECLSVLELQFIEFKEHTLTSLNQPSPTQQLRDEVTRLKSEHRAEVQELRAALRGLEEDNQAMKTELRRLREEHSKTAQASQMRSLQRDLEGLREALHNTHRSASTDTHTAATPSTDTHTTPPRTPSTHTLDTNTAPPNTDTHTAATPSTDTHTTPPSTPSTHTSDTHTTPHSTDAAPPNTPIPDAHTVQMAGAEIVILSDSNGKYLNEKRLFPGKRVKKIWCPTTQTALELLSGRRLSDPKHIVIHTGTNDLSARRGDVAKALRQVAAKATKEFPSAKVTISTLLPRADVPQRVIHGINVEVSRGCALMPNVHLAHHRDIRHHHLYDPVHLNREGVRLFAKVLKDTALGRDTTSTYTEVRSTPSRPRVHRNPPTSRPRRAPSPRVSAQRSNGRVSSQQQQQPAQPDSYAAAAASRAGNPATAELNQIRKLLNIICTKLMS